MNFTYRVPLRQFEYVEVEGDSFKEVMKGVKQVHELLEGETHHKFPTRKKEEDLTF